MKPVNHKERSNALTKFIAAYSITAILTIAAVAFVFSSFAIVDSEGSASHREINELKTSLDDLKTVLMGIDEALDKGEDLDDLFGDMTGVLNEIRSKNVYNSSNESLRTIGRDLEAVLRNYRSLLNKYMIKSSRLSEMDSENPCEDIEKRHGILQSEFDRLQNSHDRCMAQLQASPGGGSTPVERIPNRFVNDFLDAIREMADQDDRRSRKEIGRSKIKHANRNGFFNDFNDMDKVNRIIGSLN